VRPRPKSELRSAEGATWGPRPGAQPANRAERPRMRLVGWKPLVKGTLRGFANVELPIGLRLIDCPIFVGPNGPGAAPPSKPVLDCEGRQARLSGKPQFAPVVEGRNRGLADRFSATVLGLVEGTHPAVLSERAP